jgi:hypothetical protein
MKKLYLLLLAVFLLPTQALSLDVSLQPTRQSFFNNETAVLNLSITNNEVTFAAESLFVNYTLANKTNTIPLDVLPAGETFTKLINAPALPAGTYPLDYLAGYDFIGSIDTTNVFHSSLQILPSQEITMKVGQIKIKAVSISSNVVANQPFEVTVELSAKTSGELEIASGNNVQIIPFNSVDSQNVSKSFTISQTGNSNIDVRAFSGQGNSRVLQDFVSSKVMVGNPSDYAPVPSIDLTVKQANVTSAPNPINQFVSSVSCFIVGGCTGDLEPPNLTASYQRDNSKTVFSVDATDQSKIESCKIRLAADWINMTAKSGNFKSQKEIAVYEAPHSAEILHNPEVACSDEFGNIGYTTINFKKIECTCGYIEGDVCVPYACCSDSDCGEFQKCDTTAKQCVGKSECIEVVKNGDSSTKADILIVGDGYDYQKLKEETLNVLDYSGNTGYYGIFSLEPFKSNKNKFNIWMITSDSIEYVNGKPTRDSVLALKSKCPQTEYLMLFSPKSFRSYCYSYGGDSYLSFGSEDGLLPAFKGRLAAHEFGHGFAQLADEYSETGKGSYPRQPNCAPDKATAEKWWGDLAQEGKAGYYTGCSYSFDQNVRPTLNSVMFMHWVITDTYYAVNERGISKILEKYS